MTAPHYWAPLSLLGQGVLIINVLDPLAYSAGAFVILTACAFAALIPARRAARIDPVAALRQD